VGPELYQQVDVVFGAKTARRDRADEANPLHAELAELPGIGRKLPEHYRSGKAVPVVLHGLSLDLRQP
jgi:hypothetical protein